MAVPKKKTSKSKTRKRRAANMRTPSVTLTKCPKCGEAVLSHTVCKVCGNYKGKKIIETKV